MPRKQRPPSILAVAKNILHAGDDSAGMRGLMFRYLEALAIRNYTDGSVEFRAHVLHYFATWCEERGLTTPSQVTRPILKRYQRHLFYYRKANGLPLGVSTQYGRTVMVCSFFRWLTRNDFLASNPASELDLPRLEKRLPKAILSVAEVEKVMAQPELKEPLGLRDRAIMETLYSTGMRRREAVGLTVFNLDVDRGTVMIRQGKGRKDRLIPIGERALKWIDKYLTEVRESLVTEPDDGWLFLSEKGTQLGHSYLGDVVRKYIDAAEIGKQGSCHLFRHTMATLMLEGGADIRFIQMMLGHEELTSTQIYTQVAINKLKEVHSLTHPGAKLKVKKGAKETSAEVEAADLLEALAEESEEEESDEGE